MSVCEATRKVYDSLYSAWHAHYQKLKACEVSNTICCNCDERSWCELKKDNDELWDLLHKYAVRIGEQYGN